LQRPSSNYGGGLSLIQHQINRAEAGKKLTRANAEDELVRARERIRERWGEAIRKGVKVRKHSDLIRHQGLTSARLLANDPHSTNRGTVLPEVSQASMDVLGDVMPFPSFSLKDDE
jgi:putative transposase